MPKPKPPKSARFSWQLRLPQSKRERWLTLAGAAVAVVLIVLAVPYSRYGLIGQFVKRPATIDVVDSRTHAPVSDVTVMVGHTTYKTDAKGEIKLTALPVGGWSVTANKRYYNLLTTSIMQPLFGAPKTFSLNLVAIGNQVTVKVVNTITGKPLAKAAIAALGTTATTDAAGQAVIVLPVGRASVPGTASLAGYNDATISVKNTETDTTANTFGLTPVGKIFYLDKRTGVINVMKSNLDGTNPQVVVTGTGKESDTGTVLLASRDWKYLALLASRDSTNQPKLYVINAATGQMSLVDQGDANLTLVGWDGDYLIYTVSRNGYTYGEPGAQSLKSYNASTGTLTSIYNQAPFGQVNSEVDSNAVIMGNSIIFSRVAQSPGPQDSQDIISFMSVQPDGSKSHSLSDISKTVGNFPSVDTQLYKPDEVAFQISISGNTAYYELDNGTISSDPSLADTFNQDSYPTYLLSPSSNQTFWYEQRDGKNTLFTGDASADHPKTIASLSDYTPYGWFTDDYILLSKNGSELYIAPADLSSPPVKITDYHKPDVSFNGYGGGYGGQ